MEPLRTRWLALVAGALLIGAAGSAVAQSDSFAGLMERAMSRMDAGMMKSTNGDPDHDFATMMIPHHQGAIDMAEAELRYGKNERLRRLAQAIIVEQNQEIVVMRQILAEGPAASNPSTKIGQTP